MALFNNTCDSLFENNSHKPRMKNRMRSRLVPRTAQATGRTPCCLCNPIDELFAESVEILECFQVK